MTPLAIVSGATGGIGSVVAKHLWETGYSLLCLGHTEEKVEVLRNWFRASPSGTGHFVCRSVDINDGQLNVVVARDLLAFPQSLTLLVVCHGEAPAISSAEEDMAATALSRVLDTDVLGTHRLCQEAWHQMHQTGGGSIVLLSSLHGHATYPHRLPYSTAKSALSGLVRSLALDWGKDNIRVNGICPWQCEGPRSSAIAAQEGEDTFELYKQRSPLRRLVTAEDIARTVLWLAQCKSVTGTEIVLDCGVSASMWHRPFEEP